MPVDILPPMTLITLDAAYVLAFIGGIIWAVRLEGRINTQEKLAQVVSKNLSDKLEEIVEELRDLRTAVLASAKSGRS